jgi:hypothetical protein
MSRKPFGFRIKEFNELSSEEIENQVIPYEILFIDNEEFQKRIKQILNYAFQKGWLNKRR